MGGITKTLLGGPSKQKTSTTPTTFPRLPAVRPRISTGRSVLGADLTIGQTIGSEPIGLKGIDITTELDPEIAQLRQEALTGRREILGDVLGDISTLRSLENPFVQARVSPLVSERERARRDAVRRGVSGPLTALATNPFNQAISEEGARAAFDVQIAIKQSQEVARGLLGDISGEGRQLLEQELALFGLAQQEIRDIINSQLEQTVASSSQTQQTGAQKGLLGPLAGGLGAVLGGGGASGGLSAFGGLFCWVAREVYGPENPKWLVFRAWLLTRAPRWLCRLYLARGPAFAQWLRRHPRWKLPVRLLMDRVTRGEREPVFPIEEVRHG